MKIFNKEFSNYILSLNSYVKRSIAILVDVALCVLCTWLALILRLEELLLFKNLTLSPVIISILIAIPIFWAFGLYKTIFRYTGIPIIFTIFTSTSIYGLVYFLIVGAYGLEGVPRSIGIIQPILLLFSILVSRLSIKYILAVNISKKKNQHSKKNILIYGAGDAGRQLLISLENNFEFKVVGIIDDNVQFQKRILLGQKIYSFSEIENLIKTKDVSIVFLALPSVSRSKRNQIIDKLEKYKLIVKTLPSISELVEDRISISHIKDYNIDDLLDRDEVKPDYKLLNKNINSKVVLVTGAGGSIGSELCRQIVKLKPLKLLLLEFNEYALYKIYDELSSYNKNLSLIPLLVNIQDQKKLESIFDTFKVCTVYHAAAYKHVPLVEENICEGIKNNVFSTVAVAKASINKKVSNLVLISSDKAVRPTNIMGATKRLSELCMQGIYDIDQNKLTNFSIVRFGNVLESSGSVIPKFKQQIKMGGPVTLTHNDVSRYFMTITEAAQLVIQASAMGKKSEVFILEMGNSVKIKSLIHKMISLSGYSVKDDKNPNGDIEITVTGLRPGEKLYEELLIGNNPQKTSHPKIKKTEEFFLPFSNLQKDLERLEFYINENNIFEAKNTLDKIIKSYKSNSKIVDHLYIEKLMSKNDNNIIFEKDKKNKVIKIK